VHFQQDFLSGFPNGFTGSLSAIRSRYASPCQRMIAFQLLHHDTYLHSDFTCQSALTQG